MVFKCQEDSYLQEYESRVISCEKSSKTPNGLYEVILEDTILFPEGGGQPSDTGYLNDAKVLQVMRRGAQALHIVDQKLNVDEMVKQRIDWERRFDHMQQHSGQHLLSAVLERDFNVPTIAWWLGEEVSYVELDNPELKSEQIQVLEDKLNAYIREALPVSVRVFKSVDQLNHGHTRGLPEDHRGDVRLITIEGVDENLCCGTHVTNLSQLQMVKIVNVTKSTRKGKSLLNFLVGNRVTKRLQACLDREEALTGLLNNHPKDHPMLVEKLLKNSRSATKVLQTVLKDVAINEAIKFKDLSPPPKYYTLYRKEADASFMQQFLKEIGPTETILLLAVGEEKANMILSGRGEVIAQLKDKIMEILKAKGALHGNKFQAKVENIQNFPKAELLLKEYFSSN